MRHKNVHHLIEAFKQTKTEKKLVIVGGNFHTDDYEKYLHALALGNKNIIFTGVQTGEASERDGNYFGTAVNRAARLMAVAHGGQVVCSQASATLAGDAVSVRSLGEHRLRDLAAAEQIFQVGEGAFPPLRSVDAVPTNLPTVRTENMAVAAEAAP